MNRFRISVLSAASSPCSDLNLIHYMLRQYKEKTRCRPNEFHLPKNKAVVHVANTERPLEFSTILDCLRQQTAKDLLS